MSEILNGVVRDIFILALVMGLGLLFGKFKVKGVSIGATWILFIGIVASHFGLIVSPGTLSFVKEFGLIIFVYSIGLQVGPGFFHSFASGGVKLNLMSLLLIVIGAGVTVALSAIFGEDLATNVLDFLHFVIPSRRAWNWGKWNPALRSIISTLSPA